MRIHLVVAVLIVVASSALGQPRRRAAPGEYNAPPARQERQPDNLKVGAEAPPFKLPLLGGKESIALADLHTKRPAVLVFGSFTCPPFRGSLPGIDEVYNDFRDRAEFLFVYIREAHPDSILRVVNEGGDKSLLKITQTSTLAARQANADVCRRTLELKVPIAIDGEDNAVNRAYAGWPNRIVVVGTNGKIMFASNWGPGGISAAKVREWLDKNLPQAKDDK
jgi:hypothetical protein